MPKVRYDRASFRTCREAVCGRAKEVELQHERIILGIDPGLANTGWGIVSQQGSRLSCRAYGCISTPAGQPLAQRLKKIHDADNLEYFHTLGRIVASVPGKGVSIAKKHIGKYGADHA